MSIKAMNWAFNQNLTPSLKIVLLALADHSDNEGVCWPGKKGLIEKCGLSKATLCRVINKLAEENYMAVQPRNSENGARLSNVYVLNINNEEIEGGLKMRGGGLTCETGGVSNDTPDTLYINRNKNHVMSSKSQTKKLLKKDAEEIVHYLNKKSGYNYQAVDSHLVMIMARMKEGVDKKTIFDVIDAKCEEWLNDDEMHTYLRPATLFAKRNFDNYAGQLSPKNKTKKARPYHKDFKREEDDKAVTFINCVTCKQYKQAFTSYQCKQCCSTSNIENKASNSPVVERKSVSVG